MFSEAYIAQSNNSPAQFGGIFDTIMQGINAVNAGLGAYSNISNSGIFGTGGGSSGQPQYKGLAAITQGTQQALQALDALIAQIGQQPYEQILQRAQQIVAALSDPAVFYQARSGRDAAVLAAAKTAAQAKLQQIASTSGGVISNTTNQAGQVITSTGNAITTGLDTGASLTERLLADNTLVYIALGFGIFYLLKK